MSSRTRAWSLLLWDAALELLTGSRRDVCGETVMGQFPCERREGHGGRWHAHVGDRIACVWRRGQ